VGLRVTKGRFSEVTGAGTVTVGPKGGEKSGASVSRNIRDNISLKVGDGGSAMVNS
jgi:hypothetical protein